MSGDRKPFSYLSSPFDLAQAVFSPNGRWLAFVSNESGSYQVYVQSFPDASQGEWEISIGASAMAPRWSRDGRELYFIDPAGNVTAVAVTTDGQFAVGKRRRLFTIIVDYPLYPTIFPYEAAPDGQRFLTPSKSTSAWITVVLNWASSLKKP